MTTATSACYLALAMDAWSRRIVGWSMRDDMCAERPPADPVDPPADTSPPARSLVTQGVRGGAPGPGPPDVDEWIRDRAHRTGGGGVWTMP